MAEPVAEPGRMRVSRLVVKVGIVYNPAELLESARGRLGPASPDDADWWKGRLRFASAREEQP